MTRRGGGGSEGHEHSLDGGKLVAEGLVEQSEGQDLSRESPDGRLGIGVGGGAVGGEPENTGRDGVNFGRVEDLVLIVTEVALGSIVGMVVVGGVVIDEIFVRLPLDGDLGGLGGVGVGSDLRGGGGRAGFQPEEG